MEVHGGGRCGKEDVSLKVGRPRVLWGTGGRRGRDFRAGISTLDLRDIERDFRYNFIPDLKCSITWIKS